jgi:hypothetical protein
LSSEQTWIAPVIVPRSSVMKSHALGFFKEKQGCVPAQQPVEDKVLRDACPNPSFHLL